LERCLDAATWLLPRTPAAQSAGVRADAAEFTESKLAFMLMLTDADKSNDLSTERSTERSLTLFSDAVRARVRELA
jgi:hypothetical protein